MGSRAKKLVITAAVIAVMAATCAVLNMDVTIRQGINGAYRDIHMPLYAKWTEFLARHYEYARIVKEITAGKDSDEEKVLAIFKWTNENIRPVPANMPIVDDHILNIIIRGYGTRGQAQDVFVNLCVYANVPAFWQKMYNGDRTAHITLSFVRIDNKWRVFDAAEQIYFRNKEGQIASIEDIAADKSLLDDAGLETIEYQGIPYKDFFYSLGDLKVPQTSRSEQQIPLKRIMFELRKFFGKEAQNTGEL